MIDGGASAAAKLTGFIARPLFTTDPIVDAGLIDGRECAILVCLVVEERRMTVNAASVARRLVLAGARIVVALEVPGGTKTVELDPGDAQAFLDDPFGWKARYWGITAAQLERWHEQDRMPRCGATTKAGKRCRNALSPQCDPTDFVALDGGYCTVHG